MKKRYYIVRYRQSGEKDYYRGYIIRPTFEMQAPRMVRHKEDAMWYRHRKTAERHIEKIRQLPRYGYGHEFVIEEEGKQ